MLTYGWTTKTNMARCVFDVCCSAAVTRLLNVVRSLSVFKSIRSLTLRSLYMGWVLSMVQPVFKPFRVITYPATNFSDQDPIATEPRAPRLALATPPVGAVLCRRDSHLARGWDLGRRGAHIVLLPCRANFPNCPCSLLLVPVTRQRHSSF